MDGKDGANRFADGLGSEGREDVGGGEIGSETTVEGTLGIWSEGKVFAP